MDGNRNTLTRVVDNPAIDRVAEPLSKAVRDAYGAAGPAGRQAKNALHGVWLGHGRVINGPATQNQPVLDVRERDGQIEVRGRA